MRHGSIRHRKAHLGLQIPPNRSDFWGWENEEDLQELVALEAQEEPRGWVLIYGLHFHCEPPGALSLQVSQPRDHYMGVLRSSPDFPALLADVDWTKVAAPDPRELQEKRAVDWSKEREWLKEHANEYENQWVALSGGKLIVASSDIRKVKKGLEKQGVQAPYVMYVTREYEPVAGI